MSKASCVLPLVERSRLFSATRTVLATGVDFPGNDQQRWKSDAATSVSSDVPSSPRGRRRISEEERHALVESYVNEFRKQNNGKFPSAADAMKHAGGGFYFVRKIVQELEYASRSTQLTSRTIISAESEHGDIIEEEVAQKHTKSHVKRAKEGVKDTSVSPVKLHSRNEEEDYLHETDLKKLNAMKVEQWDIGLDVDPTADLRNQTEKQEESATLETNQHPSQSHPDPEVSDRRKDDAVYSGETSFWGSLKTLADGFMSIWRRK